MFSSAQKQNLQTPNKMITLSSSKGNNIRASAAHRNSSNILNEDDTDPTIEALKRQEIKAKI